MKILVSKSMPQLIPSTDFGMSTEAARQRKLSKLMSSPKLKELALDYPRCKLFNVVGDKDLAYNYVFSIDNQSQEMGYFIEYVTYKVGNNLGTEAVTQVGLWRNKRLISSNNLGTFIFFNYLLPHFNTIMSDTLQTESGMRFWHSRMEEAITKGLYCYGYDRMSNELTAITEDNYNWATTHYWGKEDDYETKLILISKTELKE